MEKIRVKLDGIEYKNDKAVILATNLEDTGFIKKDEKVRIGVPYNKKDVVRFINDIGKEATIEGDFEEFKQVGTSDGVSLMETYILDHTMEVYEI